MNEYDAKRDYLLEQYGALKMKYGSVSMGDMNGICNRSGWLPSEINPVVNELIIRNQIVLV